jgi:hypothetical protein
METPMKSPGGNEPRWLSFWKGLPVLAKISIVLLLMAGIYSAYNDSKPVGRSDSNPAGESEPQGGGEAVAPISRPSDAGRGQVQAQLQALQEQQAQVLAQANRCIAESNQAQARMAMAAAQGIVLAPPACTQYMPQWTAQEALLEKKIYALQTGDTHASVQDVSGIHTGGSSSPSYSSPSDGGTGAVERYSREAIRGNSLYQDENGEQHELATQKYYFRDRASGQVIPSDSPNPPNDGRDYERLTRQR